MSAGKPARENNMQLREEKQQHTKKNIQVVKEKTLSGLIQTIFFGLICLFIGVTFWFYLSGNPYYEFLLITQSETTKGLVIHSKEFEDVVEQNDRASATVYDVSYEFAFTTSEGKKIIGHGKEEYPDPGNLSEANIQPIPVTVEYISSNPEINRVKEIGKGCKTVWEFIWRQVLLGGILLIFFSSIGITIIINAIKDYKTPIQTKNY